jgi:hypothetical protein
MTDDIIFLNKSVPAQEPEVAELNKFNNLKQTLERLAGKRYVLAYIEEESGAPNIVPSEEISDIELIYLAEMIKHVIFSTSEIVPLDPA